MNKNFSGLFTYGVAGLLLLSLGLMGCPKKVTPVEGSAGLSKNEPPVSSQPPAEKPADRRAPGDSGIREERAPRQEENLPPLVKSEPEGGKPQSGAAAGEEKPGLQDVFFEFDQWVIQADARAILEKDAKWLESHPQVKIQVEGHCDERGTDEYNLALGERRAKSVMNFLTNLGVNPSRISFISYGEERGFCNEKNEACYQKNRRAHFVVQK